MAYDKFVDSVLLDANLTSVADAIRSKTGKTESLAFPEAFITEINSISGGGSVKVVDSEDEKGGIIRAITAQNSVLLEDSVTITPSSESQTIAPSTGYDGFASALIEAIPSAYIIPSGTLSISENGTVDVSQYANATVNVAGSDSGKISELITRTISEYTGNESVIRSYAFKGCSQLTSVDFAKCTNIERFAFADCSSLTSVDFPKCTNIGSFAFANCSSLTIADFPNCTKLDGYVFSECAGLAEVSFPKFTGIIQNYTFYKCYALSKVHIPSCKGVGGTAFQNCSALTEVSFPMCSSIGYSAFMDCKSLISVYLYYSSVVGLASYNAFTNTPISNPAYVQSYGSIFVPMSLVDAYKSATNWSVYADRMVGVDV